MRWSSKRASLFEFQNCEFSKYTSQKFDVRNFKNTTGLIWDAIFKDVIFTPFKLRLAWLEINIRSLMELDSYVITCPCRWAPRIIPEMQNSGCTTRPGKAGEWIEEIPAGCCWIFISLLGKTQPQWQGRRNFMEFFLLPWKPTQSSASTDFLLETAWGPSKFSKIPFPEGSPDPFWPLCPAPTQAGERTGDRTGDSAWTFPHPQVWFPILLSVPSPWSISLIAALLLGWMLPSVLTPSPACWIDLIIRQWDSSVPAHPRWVLLVILFLPGMSQQCSCF